MLTLPPSSIARTPGLPQKRDIKEVKVHVAHRIKIVTFHHLKYIWCFFFSSFNFNIQTLMLILTTKQPSRYLQEAKEPQIIDRATNETCT